MAQEHRAFDALYDKTYTVSGPRDHYREQSRAAGFLLQRCPEYNNMFSELPTYPSQTYRFKTQDKIPQFVSRDYENTTEISSSQAAAISEPGMVSGTHRYKFFKRPLLPSGPPPAHLAPVPPAAQPVPAATELPAGTQVTTATQSDYRESESQTVPYAPDYQIPAAPSNKQKHLTAARHLPEGVPEVLTLQHLKYTNGLPPGLAEVEMLEKARLKRAYEASLPPLHDAARLPLRQRMMEEWENAEWEAREQEIKSVQDERLEVLQRAFAKREVAMEARAAERVEQLKQGRLRAKQAVFSTIQQRRVNALRKLTRQRAAVLPEKGDIVDQYADFASSIYAPVTRDGKFTDGSAAGGLTIDPKPFEPTTYQEVLELEASLPAKVVKPKTKKPLKHRPANPKERAAAFVAQQVANIESLLTASKHEHDGAAGMDDVWPAPLQTQEVVAAKRKAARGPERPETPSLERDLAAASRHAAVVLLQRLVRGRAVQNNLFEGKQKRLELIKELQLEETAAPAPGPAPLSAAERAADALAAPAMVEILKILTMSEPAEQARALMAAEAARRPAGSAEEEAAAVRIQAAARGRAARKGVVARRAEAAALSGLQEAGDALGLTGSAEETAAAVRIQAIQRGRMQRQKMKAMQASGQSTRQAMLAQAEELPDLASFSEADAANVTKIQAAARGKAARRDVEAKRAAAEKAAAEKAAAAAALPDLGTFTEEDQLKVVKIQSAARGKFARKEVEAKKKAKAAQDALPPLESFSEEDQANILKIQSVARGKKARKEVAAKKAAEAAALADGVVLSQYTTQDEKAVVKIQANARGFLARKKVVEKKKIINRYTGEVMEEKPSASPSPTEMKREVGMRSPSPLVSTSPPPAKEEVELPALDTFTEEDQANILKIQSAARGKKARKEVEAKKKAKAAQDALPPLESFSEEDQANILKIQSVARGKKARKEMAAKKAAAVGGAAEEQEAAAEAAPEAKKEDELPALDTFTEAD